MKGIVTFRKFTNAPESVLRDLSVHSFDAAVDRSCHGYNFRSKRTLFGSLSSVFIYVAQAYLNIWEDFGNVTYRNFY